MSEPAPEPFEIELLKPGAKPIARTSRFSFDVFACGLDSVPPLERKVISLGYKIRLHTPYFLMFKNCNLLASNGIGVLTHQIDPSNTDELSLTLFNYSKARYVIEKNSKVCEASLVYVELPS